MALCKAMIRPAVAIAVFSVFLANAERAAHAAFDDSARDISSHSTAEVAQGGSGGYICCVKQLDAGEEGAPRVTEIRVPSDTAVKQCKLTALPKNCQNNGQCQDECKKLIKDSLQWKLVRKKWQEIADQTTKSKMQDMQRQAPDIKANNEKLGAEERSKALQRAQSAKVAALAPALKKFTDAQKSHNQITSTVTELTRQLKDLQKRLDIEKGRVEPAKQLMEESKSQLDKSTEQVKKDLQAATDAADKTYKARMESAAAEFKTYIDHADQTLKKSADALSAITKEADDVAAKTKSKLLEGMGVCKKTASDDFEAEDCCCSINHVPMRVYGPTFVNWEDCHGAFKYSGTSMFGSAESLFQPGASKCKAKICLNADGEAGACP